MKDKLSLRVSVLRRLDSPTGPWSAVKKMFRLSFGAKPFADFCLYWNPIHQYYLIIYVYKPVCKVLPRSIAVIITFAFCGFFLHDIIHIAFTGTPLITVWFISLGAGLIIGKLFKMDMSSRSSFFRVIVNLVYLLVSFEIARRLTINYFFIV